MAQKFAAAFRVGDCDRHTCTVDAGGVAPAAIQELHRRTLAQQQEIATLSQQLVELQQNIDPTAARRRNDCQL